MNGCPLLEKTGSDRPGAATANAEGGFGQVRSRCGEFVVYVGPAGGREVLRHAFTLATGKVLPDGFYELRKL